VLLGLWREFAIEVLIFAETFNIPRLRQNAIDRLVWCHNIVNKADARGKFVSPAAIRRACANTKFGSGVRKILAFGWCDYEDEDRRKNEAVLKALPQEFFDDVQRR
jgi:hypothetical protein